MLIAHLNRIFVIINYNNNKSKRMSRSYLRDKHMRMITDGRSFFIAKWDIEPRNKHRQDEMPKNSASRFIQQRIARDKISWLQEPGTFGGHKPHKGAHRMISGIIRAKLKAEYRKILDLEL